MDGAPADEIELLQDKLPQMMVQSMWAQQAERLNQPYDDGDDDYDPNDLFDRRIHGDQPNEVQQQANHNESDDDADERRTKHVASW